MNIDNLFLEITRFCNLECEHCLRGDAEPISMSLETMDNVFRDIKEVNYLLLTGGEPFIAVKQLAHLLGKMKNKEVTIYNIGIVTNGTVLSSKLLQILKELNEWCMLRISVSGDIFHMLEIEKKGFLRKREENYRNLCSEFMVNEYFHEYGERKSVVYDLLGRAKNLTPLRLDKINRMANNYYIISDAYIAAGTTYSLVGNTLKGNLAIDVNGNVVTNSRPYIQEDEESKQYEGNVNKKTLKLAICSYNEYIGKSR